MKISVIIPVYNDPEGIRDTLKSLVLQDFDGEFEVLPVDNNSSDSTGSVIDEFDKEYDFVKGLEENDIQGSYAARNKGLEEASGDIICFLDADMWVDEDYLSKVDSFFDENGDVMYAGCDVEIVLRESGLVSRYNALSGFHVEKYLEEEGYAPTCCLVCRRSVFNQVGFFEDDLESGGDLEFGRRVRDEGFSQDFIEDLTVYHPSRSSLKSLISKYSRVGRGLAQMDKLHPERSPDRSPFDPRNFLPAGLSGFRKTLEEGQIDVKLYEIPVFYCIHSLLKFTRSWSRLKHSVR